VRNLCLNIALGPCVLQRTRHENVIKELTIKGIDAMRGPVKKVGQKGD